MLRVIACIAFDHDPTLVALAAAICLLTCATYVSMLARASAAHGKTRTAWTVGAAVAFGSGTWATHFVALIGYHSTLRPAFALLPTGASFCLVVLAGIVASAARLRAPPPGCPIWLWRAVAGATLGAGIAAMHYTGMVALRYAGLLVFEPALIVASIALGTTFSVAAMAMPLPARRLPTACLLAMAICALHFTGMAGARLIPWAPSDASGALVPDNELAICVAIATSFVLLMSLAGTAVDAHLARLVAGEARRLHQFADATFEGILFCRDGRVTDANTALIQMCGLDTGSVIGRDLTALFVPEAAPALAGVLRGEIAETIETALAPQGGGVRPVELLCRAIHQDGHPTTVVAVRDISERKAAERRIGELAHFDTLTGCANRVLFRDRLAQALAMAERAGHGIAVLCCDLDRFKEVNDVHGHAAGDQILVEVANRLRAGIRETDTLARLGGDGFAIIQPQTASPDDSATLAARVVASLAEPFMVDAQPIRIGTSVGIALYPQDAASGETLLRLADLALDRSKRIGRGTFHFYAPEMDRDLRQRHTLEHDLAQAIPRGELAVHYQPVCDTVTRRQLGHEALLRWNHAEHGAISPAVFVPLAEQCGLITPIGEWVLRTACATAAAAPRPTRIAVNLSPVQIRTTDLPRLVADVLRDTGLAPERLELEITEGVLIEDAEHTLGVLRALKRQGVRLVLDDFGTGYSSLSYLRRFPFDKLKIDRSFMQGLGEDGDSDALVRSILALGHSLHLEVTAEGVETEVQLQVLRRYGCDQIQGYLLGRPAPALDGVPAKVVQAAA
jgi:diguanylate cyclase (GGDEF)-like protein/PAS domain S-box-containing protein